MSSSVQHDDYAEQMAYVTRHFRDGMMSHNTNAYRELIVDLKNLSYSVHRKMLNADAQAVLKSVSDISLKHFIPAEPGEPATVNIEQPFRKPKEELLAHDLNDDQILAIRGILEQAEMVVEYQGWLGNYIREASKIVPRDVLQDVLRSAAMPPMTITFSQPGVFTVPSTEEELLEQHLPNPEKLVLNDEETKLLAALTSFEIRKLVAPKKQLSQLETARKFHVAGSTLKRILTGRVQEGGTEYAKRKRRASAEDPPASGPPTGDQPSTSTE